MSTPASPAVSLCSANPSSVASSIFETYICREPAGDVPLLIHNGPDEYTALLRTLQRSADHFSEKDQKRVLERIRFEQARLHMQHHQWRHAMRILIPLWQSLSWRKSGWWLLLEEVDYALQECASKVGDAETLVAVRWELLNRSLTPRQDSSTDFGDTLHQLAPLQVRPKPKLRAEDVLSCVSLGFGFVSANGNVGVPLRSQLTLTSHAQAISRPITVRQIRIDFEGGLRSIYLEHTGEAVPREIEEGQICEILDINLEKGMLTGNAASPASPTGLGPLSGSADLSIVAGSTKVFNLTDVPRDAGEVEVSSIALSIQESDFDVDLLITEDESMQQEFLLIKGRERSVLKKAAQVRSNAIKILPKPPKLGIELTGIGTECFIDERMTLIMEIVNNEEADADVTLDVRLLGPPESAPSIKWAENEQSDNPLETRKSDSQKAIGVLAPLKSQRHEVYIRATSVPADYVLDVRARYYLKSDPETPILKSATIDLVLRRPFEAISTFSPVIHPDSWPDYFDTDDTARRDDDRFRDTATPQGLIQRWAARARITSFADTLIKLENLEMQVEGVQETAICKSYTMDQLVSPDLPSAELQERHFTLDVQKLDLEDRGSVILNIRLKILWRQDGSFGPPTTTYLPMPELVVPFGEPRVLASARSGFSPTGVIHLKYMIENPSSYNLSFSLTMETSDEFAFSGAKNVVVQLLPLSRQSFWYNLLPLIRGAWISPQFRAYDTQFHKLLRIRGTEGMRDEKKGPSIWVDADG